MRLKNKSGKTYVLKSAASTGPRRMLAASHKWDSSRFKLTASVVILVPVQSLSGPIVTPVPSPAVAECEVSDWSNFTTDRDTGQKSTFRFVSAPGRIAPVSVFRGVARAKEKTRRCAGPPRTATVRQSCACGRHQYAPP